MRPPFGRREVTGHHALEVGCSNPAARRIGAFGYRPQLYISPIVEVSHTVWTHDSGCRYQRPQLYPGLSQSNLAAFEQLPLCKSMAIAFARIRGISSFHCRALVASISSSSPSVLDIEVITLRDFGSEWCDPSARRRVLLFACSWLWTHVQQSVE